MYDSTIFDGRTEIFWGVNMSAIQWHFIGCFFEKDGRLLKKWSLESI